MIRDIFGVRDSFREVINLKIVDRYFSQRWTVHTSEELEDYVTKVYDCDVTQRHLYDLISSLEMEICARGIVFFQ